MGTTAEKLKYLNETKAEIKNALETPYNVMRDYPELIKKYIDNQPTKVVTDGICGNAVDVPVKTIETNGNIRQETTEGYNLLNIESKFKVTGSERIPISLPAGEYTIKADNIVTDSSSQTSFVTSFRTSSEAIADVRLTLSNHKLKFTLLKPATFAVIYSGNSFNESQGVTTTYTNLMVYEGTSDKPYEPYTGGIPSPSPDYIQKITSIGGYDNLFDKNNIISGSYVSDGNGAFVSNSTSKRTDYIEIQANSYYYIYSDKTSGNWGAWYDKDKKFISGITLGGQKEGTVNSPANAKYMAFTISYQGNLTDYSNIKINETILKIKQSGKNVFDNFKEYSYSNSNLNTTSINNGIKIEKKGGFGLWVFDNLENLDGKIVRAKSKFNDDGSIAIGLASLNGTSRTVMKENTKSNTVSSFVIPKITDDKKYLAVWLYGLDNSEISYEDLIITIDNEDITYEPYHEPKVITIDLQGNTLGKVGDVKDILKVNRNGEVEIKKNTWEETINTSDLVTLPNNNKGLVFYTSKKKTTSYSDNDYLVTNAQRNRTFNDGTVYQNPSNLVFVGSSTDTLETIKAKFNGGKILYQLATPQIITLPSISPIELWQGTNIFSLVTNLDTDFEVEYVVDKDSVTKGEE